MEAVFSGGPYSQQARNFSTGSSETPPRRQPRKASPIFVAGETKPSPSLVITTRIRGPATDTILNFFLFQVKDEYIKQQNDSFLRTISMVAKDDLETLVMSSNLDHWKETLATIATYASSSNGFPFYCEKLAERLEKERFDIRSAVLCCVCSKNFSKTVQFFSTMAAGRSQNLALQGLVERMVIWQDVCNYSGEDSLFALKLTQYAELLANSGRVAAAMRQLARLKSEPSSALLRDRIFNSLSPEEQRALQIQVGLFVGVYRIVRSGGKIVVLERTSVFRRSRSGGIFPCDGEVDLEDLMSKINFQVQAPFTTVHVKADIQRGSVGGKGPATYGGGTPSTVTGHTPQRGSAGPTPTTSQTLAGSLRGGPMGSKPTAGKGATRAAPPVSRQPVAMSSPAAGPMPTGPMPTGPGKKPSAMPAAPAAMPAAPFGGIMHGGPPGGAAPPTALAGFLAPPPPGAEGEAATPGPFGAIAGASAPTPPPPVMSSGQQQIVPSSSRNVVAASKMPSRPAVSSSSRGGGGPPPGATPPNYPSVSVSDDRRYSLTNGGSSAAGLGRKQEERRVVATTSKNDTRDVRVYVSATDIFNHVQIQEFFSDPGHLFITDINGGSRHDSR